MFYELPKSMPYNSYTKFLGGSLRKGISGFHFYLFTPILDQLQRAYLYHSPTYSKLKQEIRN